MTPTHQQRAHFLGTLAGGVAILAAVGLIVTAVSVASSAQEADGSISGQHGQPHHPTGGLQVAQVTAELGLRQEFARLRVAA